MAKVFCGETLFNAVFRAMQAMGVNALDKNHPMEKFLREAAVLPLYDAGNIGMQMRIRAASFSHRRRHRPRLARSARPGRASACPVGDRR
jgi:alkylation response protein AidB-like acyl-CoA dehydrogenase